jgi:hypothetical protein
MTNLGGSAEWVCILLNIEISRHVAAVGSSRIDGDRWWLCLAAAQR